MHTSAMSNAKLFVEKYLPKDQRLDVLEVGSYNVNGTLRDIFKEYLNVGYVGCDQSHGPCVDVVVSGRIFPWRDQAFDCVLSSSCFEHDPLFWVTFNEMVRVTKKGGYIYICVPAVGPYHGYPGDCWRFMKDAYEALVEWNPSVSLIEQYIDPSDKVWDDNVGIFQKL